MSKAPPLWKLRLRIEKKVLDFEIYEKACTLAGVTPSSRSRSKWNQARGRVYPYRQKAIRQLVSLNLKG